MSTAMTNPPAGDEAATVSDPTPIFTKMLDFITWLTLMSRHFPRLHRTTITQRLLDATLDCQERLIEANSVRGQARLTLLLSADVSLDKIRMYIRLAHLLHWLSLGQYEHASKQLVEIGRLLGGWLKTTRRTVESNRG